MKRHLSWLLATPLLLSAPDAAAVEKVVPLESPKYFVQVFGGYASTTANEATEEINNQTLTIFEETVRNWSVGGSATVPFLSDFGARVSVFGGSASFRQGTGRAELGGVSGGAELFWRDPTKGQVGVGYAYGWTSPRTVSPLESVRINEVPAFASLYTPDFGAGPIDWNLRIDYQWLDFRAVTGNTNQWAYEIRGTSIWYVTRMVDFEGGVRYFRSIEARQSNTIEGVFALEMLLPSSGRHYGAVQVFGAVGRVEEEDQPYPFLSVSRLSWGIGVQVSVHFPGVTSLVELNRAYR